MSALVRYLVSTETRDTLETFYKGSDHYLEHLLTHDEAFFGPYLTLCRRFIPPTSRMLDLGCGTGQSSVSLVKALGAQVIACDLSLKFLRMVGSSGTDRLFPVVGRAAALPFRSGAFDAVAALHFIEHIPDVEATLTEMARLVRPGGVLIIVSPNLLSPFPWLKDMAWKCMGRSRRPGWSGGWPWLLASFWRSVRISIQKCCERRSEFLFRQAELHGDVVGFDTDSVYLANPTDLAKWFRNRGFRVRQVAVGATWSGRVTARLCPWLNGLIGFVAEKPACG